MSLKNDIVLMAEAHLRNIQNLIVDLEKQKNTIDQEINKLQTYLGTGSQSIKKFVEEESE